MDKTSIKKSGMFRPIVKKLGTDCPSLRGRFVAGSLRPMGQLVQGTLCPWNVSSWDAKSRDAAFGDVS
jgi:hypothetical protein